MKNNIPNPIERPNFRSVEESINWNKTLEGVLWNINEIIDTSEFLHAQWQQIVSIDCVNSITVEKLVPLLSHKYSEEEMKSKEWSVGEMFDELYHARFSPKHNE